MSKTEWTPTRGQTGLAAIAGVLLLGGSFVVAHYTQVGDTLFSLTPKVAPGTDIPALDIIPTDKRYVFHATIYTVWATMLLSVPAFCTVWFIRRSPAAGAYWLAFWSVGLVAMLVHLYLSMGVLFEWNWTHILSDTVRVTIPVPDLVLTAWWIVDVGLGWWLLHSRGIVLHGQRLLLHIALLTVFLIGFIREGETDLSRLIGLACAATVLIALVVGLSRRRQMAVPSPS